MNIGLENEAQMPAHELWQILDAPGFEAFTAREYELRAYTELERQVSHNLIRRKMRIVTGTDLSYIPFGLAHKILGGNEIIYEEIQDKYLDRYEMHWKNRWIEPSLFKDKIRVSGVLRLIPIDEGLCKRIREMSLHIWIFGVGPILEGMAAEQAKKTSKKFSEVVAKWKAVNTKRGRL